MATDSFLAGATLLLLLTVWWDLAAKVFAALLTAMAVFSEEGVVVALLVRLPAGGGIALSDARRALAAPNVHNGGGSWKLSQLHSATRDDLCASECSEHAGTRQ